MAYTTPKRTTVTVRKLIELPQVVYRQPIIRLPHLLTRDSDIVYGIVSVISIVEE